MLTRIQVIGAGCVGLSIARQLAARDGTSTILIERHGDIGTETSSRSSEVIHAGIYYPADSLKTTLCIKGKHMMYDLCQKQGIPHKNTKKWVLAQDEQQMAETEKVHKHAQALGVPTRFLSRQEIQDREPDVRAVAGVLESESTGIVDSHALMVYLQGDFEDRGGDTAFQTAVTRIEPIHKGEQGYRISFRGPGGEEDSISVEALVNSAGLGAIDVNNMILPPDRHRKPYYAKGSYFSYSAGSPKPKTLLYPAPVPGHGGLGTHLTLDISGRVRFGPDVEWVDDPNNLSPNPARLKEAIEAIKTYLPTINGDAIDLDYCGIGPNWARPATLQVPILPTSTLKRKKGIRNLST